MEDANLYGYDPNSLPLGIPGAKCSKSKRKKMVKQAFEELVQDELRSSRKKSRANEDLDMLGNGMTKGEASLLLMQTLEQNPSEVMEELKTITTDVSDQIDVPTQVNLFDQFKTSMINEFITEDNTGALQSFDIYFSRDVFTELEKDSALTAEKVKSLLWGPSRKFITAHKLNRPRYTKDLKAIFATLAQL